MTAASTSIRSALTDAAARRRRPVLVPLCLDPLTARLCAELGYEAGYLSGGGYGYQLAVSEALLTVTEIAALAGAMVRRSSLPIVVDGGVGFGDPVHVARMMWELDAVGAAAVELEDQVAPKRVSHHRGVEHLVSEAEMVDKIGVAVEARREDGCVLIARTGAVRNESFDAAVERCRAYRAAGADAVMLFPSSEDEWRTAPSLVGAAAVAMAALDQHPAEQWAEWGWAMVIDPFSGQVAAFDATRDLYRRQATGETTAAERSSRFAVYRQLPAVAGLEELYDIERRTTEAGT